VFTADGFRTFMRVGSEDDLLNIAVTPVGLSHEFVTSLHEMALLQGSSSEAIISPLSVWDRALLDAYLVRSQALAQTELPSWLLLLERWALNGAMVCGADRLFELTGLNLSLSVVGHNVEILSHCFSSYCVNASIMFYSRLRGEASLLVPMSEMLFAHSDAQPSVQRAWRLHVPPLPAGTYELDVLLSWVAVGGLSHYVGDRFNKRSLHRASLLFSAVGNFRSEIELQTELRSCGAQAHVAGSPWKFQVNAALMPRRKLSTKCTDGAGHGSFRIVSSCDPSQETRLCSGKLDALFAKNRSTTHGDGANSRRSAPVRSTLVWSREDCYHHIFADPDEVHMFLRRNRMRKVIFAGNSIVREFFQIIYHDFFGVPWGRKQPTNPLAFKTIVSFDLEKLAPVLGESICMPFIYT
jgi:hypothetical protein